MALVKPVVALRVTVTWALEAGVIVTEELLSDPLKSATVKGNV
jgi:hypothetical protein